MTPRVSRNWIFRVKHTAVQTKCSHESIAAAGVLTALLSSSSSTTSSVVEDGRWTPRTSGTKSGGIQGIERACCSPNIVEELIPSITLKIKVIVQGKVL